MTTSTQVQGAQAVARALHLLERFSVDRPSWSVKELSADMQLNSSTVHRLVRALVEREFLVLNADGHTYSPGPSIMRVAQVLLSPTDERDLPTLVLPYLEHLRELTAETVGVYRRVGRQRIAIAELESPQPVRLTLGGLGRVRPLYAGAVGKVFMAWLPQAFQEELLELGRRERHLRDPERLRREFGEIRERGYAVSSGETTPGAAAIAAPIFGAPKDVVAVLSISGPDHRWTREAMEQVCDVLLDSTTRLSAAVRMPDRYPLDGEFTSPL
jgi:DNA-binding IclR family transcriptional regulator